MSNDTAEIELNGNLVKIARFDGDTWIEIGSGAAAVGKQKDRLLKMKWRVFKGDRYVPVNEYVEFLRVEAAEADNFQASDLLNEFATLGMRANTKDGYLHLPTGEKVKAYEQDGKLFYDMDDMCKALGVTREDVEQSLKKIQERGF